jgi:predicted membrane-bound spermidine synthase
VFSIPWALSFVVGFLSLSEEILWVRMAGFAYDTLPPAFSFVLACYLVGIAAGAAFGKRLCARTQNLYAAAAVVLSVAALVDVLIPLMIGRLTRVFDPSLYVAAIAIAITAASKSTLFPIVHHLGSSVKGAHVGRSMSRIYFGNILGATLGPLVTGFVALNYLNPDECFGVAAALCLLAAVVCVLKAHKPFLILATLASAVVASVIVAKFTPPGPGSIVAYAAGGTKAITNWVANRYGIIHTLRTDRGEMVLGGNIYDGIASANVDNNPNGLDRLYVLALLHPNPKRILFIGLSTGAWVRAAQGFPGTDSIDVVEINPGYLQLIHSYPQLYPVLKDPRIHIHIDDGRRWLRRNPDARFDLIVQNTSYHWRANIGSLLSVEHFEEIRRHLSPGGIVAVNTTGSFDVLATLQSVFAHAYRYTNFGYASDQPLTPDLSRLLEIRRPDRKMFTFDGARPTSVAARLSNAKLEPAADFIARRKADAEVITDDNLLTEYKHGRRFGPPLFQTVLPPEPQHFEFTDP